jgi:transcriptional regulator with XRE-family HTH domain
MRARPRPILVAMDRDGLADFLRRRRAALTPADVGLPPGQRRRTSGLRREEVAGLAHMSTDFYTRLEQRRGNRPSEATVAALSRALHLTPDERDHLFRLAGHTAPPRAFRSDHPSPALLRILDQLSATPAQIVNDLGMTLAQNPLAVALLGDQTRHTGLNRALVHRWFTGAGAQDRTRHAAAEHDELSRSYVANLRAVLGRAPDDPEARAIADALLKASPEFAALWAEHEVAVRTSQRKSIVHPTVGTMALDCQVLMSENLAEGLVVFTAAPGSDAAERLKLLAVVGDATFAPG